MIPETALTAAGPDAHLVARPRGVVHVFVGPLTPTGRLPRGARPACGARTRQLVALPERWSSLSHDPHHTRLCARCSARLSSRSDDRRADPLTTREQYRTAYAGLTPFDLHLAVRAATTVAELDQAAHLSLALYGHLGCDAPVTDPAGRARRPLNHTVGQVRLSLDPDPFTALVRERATEVGHRALMRRRHERKQAREDRVDRHGFPLTQSR